jgi:hypothetical protein
MSLEYTILTATKTAIETLTAPPTVVVREQPFQADFDPSPFIILWGADEQTLQYLFGGCGFRGYVVEVTVIVARNQLLDGSGQDTAKDWREKIRKRLVPDQTATPGAILTGVSAVWDIDAIDIPAEDGGAFRANYQVSKLGLVFRTSEAIHG